MTAAIPSKEDDYHAGGDLELSPDVWNGVIGDIGSRLRAREQLEASFSALVAQGIQASLDYIQATVAPHLANLQADIATAQDQIETIVQDGVAPNALKLEGHAAAYFATAAGLADHLADLDNPHAITPAIIGTMTTLEIEAAIQSAVDALLGGAPGALDTLNELAAALGDDENFAATVTTALASANSAIAARLPLAGGTLTGNFAIQSANPVDTLHKTGVAVWNRYIGGDGTQIFAHQGTGHNFQINAGGDIYASGLGWMSTVLAGKFGNPVWYSPGHPGGIKFANGFTIFWGYGAADAFAFPFALAAVLGVFPIAVTNAQVTATPYGVGGGSFQVARLHDNGSSIGGAGDPVYWLAVGHS
ncbi:hypothetical protein [Amorphus sp. MBR-141]